MNSYNNRFGIQPFTARKMLMEIRILLTLFKVKESGVAPVAESGLCGPGAEHHLPFRPKAKKYRLQNRLSGDLALSSRPTPTLGLVPSPPAPGLQVPTDSVNPGGVSASPWLLQCPNEQSLGRTSGTTGSR